MSKKKKKKDPIEGTSFSKKLVLILFLAFCLEIVFQSVIWGLFDRVSVELITAVTTALGAGVTVYLGKAAYENGEKIKESDIYGNPRNPDCNCSGEEELQEI